MKSLIPKLEKSFSFWFLLVSGIIFFLLRFPSLFEPYWYGDEGIYYLIGFGLRSGLTLYKEVWDNKPPLLYLIYAIGNANVFLVHFISLIFGIGALICFYFLAKKVLVQKISYSLATIFFIIIFGLPTIEGNIANAENFMLFPIVAAALILFSAVEKNLSLIKQPKKVLLFFCGFLLGISFLFKIVSIFDLAAFMTFIFFVYPLFSISLDNMSLRINKKDIYIYVFLALGFILPFFTSLLYFLLNGNLSYYIDAAFGGNVDYVGWKNYFIIPQGLLIAKVLLLLFFLLLLALVYIKKLLRLKELFIYVWLAYSLFSIFFSQRGYVHYQLLLLPSLSLLFGFMFKKKSILQTLASTLVCALVFYLVLTSFWHWSFHWTLNYYTNFIRLVSNNRDAADYKNFFDPKTIRDYTIAEYIKEHTKPKEPIFIWSNSAQIYVMSKTLPVVRFGTAYHIGTNKNNVLEANNAIATKRPRYIIITRDESYMPIDLSQYSFKATVFKNADVYERVL